MNGFANRHKKELKTHIPEKEINVYCLEDPSYSAWRKASKFSGISVFIFKKFSVSKELFEQEGNQIMKEKCFSFVNNSNNNT